MPGTYNGPPASLSGDLLTINRLMSSPAALQRRLRTFRDLRFVSDQILTQRFRTSGGAIVYEMTEPFLTDRTVEAVGAGSEYPYGNIVTGTAGLAAVSKWGLKVLLTDEEITRNVYGGAAVDRTLRKVVNTIISQVDSVTMSAIASAVTAAYSVTAGGGIAWNAAGALFLRDILRAKAVIVTTNLGYNPDTLVLNDAAFAYLMSDTTFTNALQRETTANPVYTGDLSVVAGLSIIVSPAVTTGNAYVLDSQQLGGMADEQDAAPGYAVSDLAVQVKSIRRDDMDAWDLQGRRKTVPVIQEPAAAVKITNTGL